MIKCINCLKEVDRVTNLNLFAGGLCESCYNCFSEEESSLINSQSKKDMQMEDFLE